MHPAFKPYLTKKTKPRYRGGKHRNEVDREGPLYKLNSNENPLGTSPLAIEAIRHHTQSLNEYPERTAKSLNNALSHFYNHKLVPEQFISANSGVGVIELITHAFLESNLETIISTPAFGVYADLAKNTGATVIDIPLQGPQYTPDIEGIIDGISDKTRLIWVCSPNNPTGTYIPKPLLNTLIDRLPPHVILAYDEVYYHFAEAPDFTTALPYVSAGKNVIGINSFSKIYGMAGMRAGYAYSTPEIAEYINKTRRPFLIDSLSLAAAKAALDDRAFVQQTLQVIREGKIFLYEKLDELGVEYWKSEANFILIKIEMDDKAFVEKMFDNGIMVRPVAGFGAPGCIRITIGTQEANETFIRALKKTL